MTNYFKNVKSFEDLKSQYKELLKANHPDNGGDVEIMKEINVQFDAAFKIWKDRHNTAEPQHKTTETADSVRSKFYTDFGWEGSNHSWNRSLKEVAQIVRAYVKEKYPTYKFSVRTSYASMCQELHVTLKESPIEIYKTFEELTEDDKDALIRRAMYNHYFNLTCWNDAELKAELEKIWREHGNFFKCLNEVTQAVIEDVDNFVKSYNYSDCDGQIDYFHVDFYYFGCAQNNGKDIFIVPKTARIKKTATAPAKKAAEPKQAESESIEQKSSYTYKITKGEDTRDGSELWVVRIVESLSKAEYIAVNKAMKELNGYYSKFKHGFIFRFDPAEVLGGVA